MKTDEKLFECGAELDVVRFDQLIYTPFLCCGIDGIYEVVENWRCCNPSVRSLGTKSGEAFTKRNDELWTRCTRVTRIHDSGWFLEWYLFGSNKVLQEHEECIRGWCIGEVGSV